MSSTFGKLFRIATFGESHGGGVGVVVEGCPPRLEIDEALRIMEQVGLALIHAHERGIVHRDLKPGNIFLLTDGRCKVLDFGVALIKLSQETMRREFERTDEELEDYLGEELDVAGTPKYMAPEQSLGEEQGPTVDIWALGIILYRLLTGELPFRSPLAAAMKPMLTAFATLT